MAKHAFITKPEDNVRMEPKDEYTHEPEAAINFNESAYYNIYDGEQKVGGWFRIGNRVNEGYAEVSICLYFPDGSAGFMFQKASITTNDAFEAGGARFDIVEPYKKLHVSYDGEILVMADPHALLNPSKAFKENPKKSCSIKLDYTGISPIYGGEHLNDDGSPIELDMEHALARAHFEQHVKAEGTITVGDDTWTISGYGLRDHSWGPRYWQNIYWYRWLPISFDENFGAMIMTTGTADGQLDSGGMILNNGEYELITECTVDSEWDDDFNQTALRAWAKTEKGEYIITGKIITLVPVRNRRQLDNGEWLHTRITEAMTEYRYEDKVGYGLSEYCDQIIDGEPVGKTIPAAR